MHRTTPALAAAIATAALAFAATGCGRSDADQLVGQYSSRKAGAAELRIGRGGRGEQVTVSIRQRGQWSAPERLDTLAHRDAQALFGPDWKGTVEAARGRDAFVIAKLTPGTVVGRDTIRGGYFMFFALGGGEVYRVGD